MIETSKLNKIRIDEFSNVNIGDMFQYMSEANISRGYVLKAFYRMLRKTIFFSNEFKKEGNPDTLFLFSNSYADRLDLLNTFRKVVALSKNHVEMVGCHTKRLHIRFCREFFKLRKWNLILKDYSMNLGSRVYILEQIYSAYIDLMEYRDLVQKWNVEIQNLVTMCDVHGIDYYFTEYFNAQGKNTVTLQHGIFSSTANAWAYSHSKSKFFLANSQYGVEEAVLSGHERTGLIAAGLPSLIMNHQDAQTPIFQNHTIGVVLEGESCHEDNRRMISFMQTYCKENHKELYIKLHPTCRKDAYDDVIDYESVRGIIGRELSILDFAAKIDVAIIRNSTSLLELVSKGVPCFIFVSEGQKMDVYKNVHQLRFETVEELSELLDSILRENYGDEFGRLQQYFGDARHTKETYMKTLWEIGIT